MKNATLLLSLFFGSVSSLGQFLMVIGGFEDTSYLDDVELVSINPVLNPVPECLSQLNSLPHALTGAAGAVDYSRK